MNSICTNQYFLEKPYAEFFNTISPKAVGDCGAEQGPGAGSERRFAAAKTNGEVAPIPAIRPRQIELAKPTKLALSTH
jgi:hypothetical protein